ncbi:MAG: hypothetical protein FWD82_10615 [Defluviitaleaceae bacterium]|nr:hypothetical protein [Defluviitaleaceae bacterium]
MSEMKKQKEFLVQEQHSEWHKKSNSEIFKHFKDLDELDEFTMKFWRAIEGDLKHSHSNLTTIVMAEGRKNFERLNEARRVHPETAKRQQSHEQKIANAAELGREWRAEGLCFVCGNKLGGLLKKTCKEDKMHKHFFLTYPTALIHERDETWLKKAQRENLHKASLDELKARFTDLSELEFYIERLHLAVTGDFKDYPRKQVLVKVGKDALEKLRRVKSQHPEFSKT